MRNFTINTAHRNLAALQYDVAFIRSDAKSLRNAARASDKRFETQQIEAVMDLLDRCSVILNDPRLFHPTLF